MVEGVPEMTQAEERERPSGRLGELRQARVEPPPSEGVRGEMGTALVKAGMLARKLMEGAASLTAMEMTSLEGTMTRSL